MKTAIVHEWLVNYAGAEKCIESFTNIWQDADIFTLVDFLNNEERQIILKGKNAYTSFIQKLPFARKSHRKYLALFPLAIEQLDISGYETIISSSHAVAKGVLTSSNQLHICYCHTPMRYAWDLYHSYLKETGLNKGLGSLIVKPTLHYLRMWDYISANRVNHFIANSKHIAKRIMKVYGRTADVIYPPVDVDKFETSSTKENYFFAASRFVPYKRMDIIVEAFNNMPEERLLIAGDGSDFEKVKNRARKNIEFIGYQSSEGLKKYMQKAKAFVFAAEEDFGIIIVEAMACGIPVIAYGVGGAAESVIPDRTGLFFEEQTSQSIIEAVKKFKFLEHKFDPGEIRCHSEKFSRKIFEENIRNYVSSKQDEFFNTK